MLVVGPSHRVSPFRDRRIDPGEDHLISRKIRFSILSSISLIVSTFFIGVFFRQWDKIFEKILIFLFSIHVVIQHAFTFSFFSCCCCC